MNDYAISDNKSFLKFAKKSETGFKILGTMTRKVLETSILHWARALLSPIDSILLV